MDPIAQFAQALQDAGLNPKLIDIGAEPYHIAVPQAGQTIDDEPVLRINLLDSHAGDLELWQMIMVFPEQAVTDAAWELTTAMLNPVNRVLIAGKVIADEDSQMLYVTYNHISAPGGSVLQSGPPLVRLFLENCAALAPGLATALTTDPHPEVDPQEAAELDAVMGKLTRSEADLQRLLAQLAGHT